MEECARLRSREAAHHLREVPVTDATEVELKQPGAYKLLAVTKMPDGTSFHSETGVVVKAPAKLPGIVLQLDKRRSTPALNSRVWFTLALPAKLLLTLRDSTGIKLTKTPDGRRLRESHGSTKRCRRIFATAVPCACSTPRARA